MLCCFFFFFNDTATTEIYTLSLHDALPISTSSWKGRSAPARRPWQSVSHRGYRPSCCSSRSEEHTSELQSLAYLVCRLLLEKKKPKTHDTVIQLLTNLMSNYTMKYTHSTCT